MLCVSNAEISWISSEICDGLPRNVSVYTAGFRLLHGGHSATNRRDEPLLPGFYYGLRKEDKDNSCRLWVMVDHAVSMNRPQCHIIVDKASLL
ncbi:hypothetical protein LSAT2_004816 [Lamellibrachia satsuma]|nr:hypothetical protein LSAT2_004816 [Lamellibrachia satsuma]